MPTNIVMQFEKQNLMILIFNHRNLIILLSVTFKNTAITYTILYVMIMLL